MAEASQGTQHNELYSDLDVLVEMVKNGQQDEQTVVRHLESLKTKLDNFARGKGASGGSPG